MNSNTRRILLTLIGMAVFIAQSVYAEVPVRISINFIMSSTNTRPISGNLNTDAEINTEFDWGNTILIDNNSEFTLQQLGSINELTGVSSWYSTNANQVSSLRAAAVASPTAFNWRSDAINIYINGGTGSAASSFPPNNDIIMMNQWCGNTPSCILHELGHSFDLWHTHETCCVSNQDKCDDTIADNASWSKDQIAQNNYGCNYSACTTSQRNAVDLVFNNVMSYHTSEPQLLFSTCQKDIVSTTNDSDRSWMLSRQPVYVDGSYTGSTQNGRFPTPYKTVQGAIASGLYNETLVIEAGTSYAAPTSVFGDAGDYSLIMPRSGSATVGNGILLWDLPSDLSDSQTQEVSHAAKEVGASDNAARAVLRQVETDAARMPDEARKAARAEAQAAAVQHRMAAIDHLKVAEPFAQGKEKIAILYEIAQRYRDENNCDSAKEYFNLVAEQTVQNHLRERAQLEIKMCSPDWPKPISKRMQEEGGETEGN